MVLKSSNNRSYKLLMPSLRCERFGKSETEKSEGSDPSIQVISRMRRDSLDHVVRKLKVDRSCEPGQTRWSASSRNDGGGAAPSLIT